MFVTVEILCDSDVILCDTNSCHIAGSYGGGCAVRELLIIR